MNNNIIDPITTSSSISDIEAYKICLEIQSQLMDLASPNRKVLERKQFLDTIKAELVVLSQIYKGTALNELLETITASYNKIEKEILSELSSYTMNYGDPTKVGDGYAR